MNKEQELSYNQGQKSAYLALLRICLSELGIGIDHPAVAQAMWVIERQETINALRDLCEQLGDNDWPDDLHLGDVIEKHLVNYLPQKEEDTP